MQPSGGKILLLQIYDAFNARVIDDLDRLLDEGFVELWNTIRLG